jgi:hypothetical protein
VASLFLPGILLALFRNRIERNFKLVEMMKSKQVILEMGIVVVSVLYGLGNVVNDRQRPPAEKAEAKVAVTKVLLETRVQVRPDELPELVRKTLNETSYASWTITDAFLVTEDDGAQYYEVAVRKADERSRMKIDTNGQVLN